MPNSRAKTVIQGLWESFLEEVGVQFGFEDGKRSCISNVGRERVPVPYNRDLLFKRSLAKPFELGNGNKQ